MEQVVQGHCVARGQGEGVKDVAHAAQSAGQKAHVGRVFELCVEKGSELPKGSKGRKYKGRSVFQGDQVKDENWDSAIFAELGSSPASMQAGKAVDAYGLLHGHSVQQAYAEQAYIQSVLGHAYLGKVAARAVACLVGKARLQGPSLPPATCSLRASRQLGVLGETLRKTPFVAGF